MRILVVVLLFVAFPAFAVEPFATSELLKQCSSTEDTSRQVCQAWVRGFVAGAFASRTARYVDPKKPETFSERAKRTRSSRRRTVYGSNFEAGYCLSDKTTVEEIVLKINAHAETLEKVPEHANQLMLGLLRKHYPCP